MPLIIEASRLQEIEKDLAEHGLDAEAIEEIRRRWLNASQPASPTETDRRLVKEWGPDGTKAVIEMLQQQAATAQEQAERLTEISRLLWP